MSDDFKNEIRRGLKVLKEVNDFISSVEKTVSILDNFEKDFDNGTTRNSVTNLTAIAGGSAGEYAGCIAGAEAGALIGVFEGPVGVVVGSIVGGIAGSAGARKVVDSVGDKVGYDMKEKDCGDCGTNFKARVYKGQTRCDDCSAEGKKKSQ